MCRQAIGRFLCCRILGWLGDSISEEVSARRALFDTTGEISHCSLQPTKASTLFGQKKRVFGQKKKSFRPKKGARIAASLLPEQNVQMTLYCVNFFFLLPEKINFFSRGENFRQQIR
jgi:hypothetical protein